MSSSAKRAWAALRSSMMRKFASRTCFDAYSPASGVKRPRSSTGENAGRPWAFPRSKSSGPWPGAVWTSPV